MKRALLLVLLSMPSWAQEQAAIDPAEGGWGTLEGSYVLRHIISKTGQSNSARSHLGESLSMSEQWNIGPLTISVRLDARDGGDPLGGWPVDTSRANILDWADRRDMYADHQHLSRTDGHFYQQLQPELDRVLDNTQKYVAGARAIYRVLRSFWHYKYYHQRFTDDPETQAIDIIYGGSSYSMQSTTTWTDGSQPQSDSREDSSESWTLEEINEFVPSNLNWQPRTEAVIWHIEHADIEIVQQMLADIERLREDLTLDLDALELDEENVRFAETYAQDLHFTFRDLMLDGLRDVVRHAWFVLPADMPAALFAEPSTIAEGSRTHLDWDENAGFPHPVDYNGVPLIDADATLSLPTLNSEAYVILFVPEFEPLVKMLWLDNGRIRYDSRTGQDPEGERIATHSAHGGDISITEVESDMRLDTLWSMDDMVAVRGPLGSSALDLDLSYQVREVPWRYSQNAESLAVEDVAVEFAFYPEGAELDENLAEGAGDEFVF